MKMKTAYTIGRYSPPHKGHINTFLWLLTMYDRLIIGIGSCYEVGSARHPLLAFMREKMIYKSLQSAGVLMSRVSFVHLQDFCNDWDGWWRHITSIPGIKNVDTLVTGNFEQIIGEIEARKISLNFSLVNPELEMPKEYHFPYHATDLRNAIRDNDYETFRKIAATGTIDLMGHVNGFAGIREALDGNGTKFAHGRQTVDLVFTCQDVFDSNKHSVLCGFRKKDKADFPGYLALPGGAIDEYENAMDAAVREFYEETNLRIDIVNRCLEPAHVVVYGQQPIIGVMEFVGLFSSDDLSISGGRGGSSQVFCIHLDCSVRQFEDMIQSKSDLENVAFFISSHLEQGGMAYQQSDMVKEALKFI